MENKDHSLEVYKGNVNGEKKQTNTLEE